MNRSIEELYQKIANKIGASIDDDWLNASVRVEFGDSVCQLQGTYQIDRSDVHSKSFATDFELAQLFQQLLEEMARAGEQAWKEGSFFLDRDGNFNLTFSY